MQMKLPPKYRPAFTAAMALLFLAGCSGLPREEDQYANAWDSVVGSPEWNASLTSRVSPSAGDRPAYYALPGTENLNSSEVTPEFLEVYPKLVSRAYFRLIADARAADYRVRTAYQEAYLESHKEQNRNNPALERECETAKQRFLAHRRMLEGLVSWRAFHQFGSDDLDFFLKEQLDESYRMYSNGLGENQIVAHLMNTLADLYHKGQEGTSRYPLF